MTITGTASPTNTFTHFAYIHKLANFYSDAGIITFTYTDSPTLSPTDTSTITPTNTITMTSTDTLTVTQTYTDTATYTITQTYTNSPTITQTSTITPTPLPSPVDLIITKKALNGQEPAIGALITYEIDIQNPGYAGVR